MDYQTVNGVFNEAESVMRSATRCGARGVEFAAGKLRSMGLSTDTLRKLKHELQGFNAKRGKWYSN